VNPPLQAFLGVARAGRIADGVLRTVVRSARPGVTVGDLDRLACSELARLDASPAMLGFTDPTAPGPFPLALSLCVNDEIAGASDPARLFQPGDLVTVDLVVQHRSWHADAAVSWVIPGAAQGPRAALADASRAVTAAGVQAIRPGSDWSTVARAMAAEAASRGVTLLRGFDGHTLGRTMHAPPRLPTHPDEVDRFPRVVLQPGMILTVEPVVGFKDPGCVRDGWLERTADGSDACFTEVTVAVGAPDRAGRADFLVLAGFLDPTTCMT
jgi:methionyl aminopeptidase